MPTTLNARDQPPAELSDQKVSELAGAVQGSAVFTRGSPWAAMRVSPRARFLSRVLAASARAYGSLSNGLMDLVTA
jgi:hypothetical protein